MGKKDILLLKNALYYGLILGAVLILVSLLEYIFDVNLFSLATASLKFLLTLAIITFIIAFGTISLRKRQFDNKIGYGHALLSGILIGVFATILYSLYSFVFYKFFEPSLINEYIDKYAEVLENNPNITDEMYDKLMVRMEKTTPERMFRSALFSNIIISTIISLIVAVFIRKKDKIVESETY